MTGIPIYPIAYTQFQKPREIRYAQTPYTTSGRSYMHDDLSIDTKLMHDLMRRNTTGSLELVDNMMSLFSAQNGRCPVVGKPFVEVEGIFCHHIVPKCRGGDDSYHNLILINKVVTPLLREISKEAAKTLIKELGIKKKGIGKVNYLRHRLGLESI